MVLKPWLLFFFLPGSADRVHQPTGTLVAAAVPERDGGDQVHGGHQQDPVGEHSPRPRGCLLLEVLQETRGKAAHCCKRRAPVLQETRGKVGHCWKWRAPVFQETRGKAGHCWKWRAPVFQEHEVKLDTAGNGVHLCSRKHEVRLDTTGNGMHLCSRKHGVSLDTVGNGVCAPVLQETRGKAGYCLKWRALVFQEVWNKAGHC